MPRSSSSTSSSRSVVPYRPSASSAPVVPHVPAIQQPTLGETVKQGFGLGVGSGLGHALVGRMFGIGAPTNQIHPAPSTPANAKGPCEAERKSFESCLLNNSDVCYNQQTALTQCLQLSKKDRE